MLSFFSLQFLQKNAIYHFCELSPNRKENLEFLIDLDLEGEWIASISVTFFALILDTHYKRFELGNVKDILLNIRKSQEFLVAFDNGWTWFVSVLLTGNFEGT